MQPRMLLALVVACLMMALAGCGGGDDDDLTPPQSSSIEGRVNVQGSVADYQLLLDGQPVPGALQADGSYAVSVAPGEHRIGIVSEDGMEGGYTTIQVPDGERVRAPEIVPELGGQIVGIVTVLGQGGLTPLAGVEVTAQPAVMIMLDETGEPQPVVYPPPEGLPSFSTFTDADGSFIIRAVPPGEYTVSVQQPGMEGGWQWVWVDAGHTAVADFTLREAIEPGVGTVQGTVVGVQGGLSAPVMGARVTISTDTWWGPVGPPEVAPVEPAQEGDGEGSEPGVCPPDPGMIAPPYFESVSTLTDASGQYTLNAPAGYASIEVYMPGWAPVWEELRVLPDETLTRDFVLEELAWIEPPYGGGGEVRPD